MNHTSKTNWFRAIYNKLKELEELARLAEVDAWHHVKNQKYIVWDNALSMKHGVELKESGLVFLPDMASCEELRDLDIYSHHVCSVPVESA